MRALALAVALLSTSLAGCELLGVVGGALTGAAAGGASGNAAIGIATAVAVETAIDTATRAQARHASRAEQDAIVAAAADINTGEARPWELQHRFSRKTHGEVRVTRVIKTPLATCKELLFSVVDKEDKPAWFTTSACQQGAKWKWAAAEPAVERWGNLQ